MPKRKPLKREYSKYIEWPEEIENIAKESARKVAKVCSDIDLIDIEYLFTHTFSFELCLIGMEEDIIIRKKEIGYED